MENFYVKEHFAEDEYLPTLYGSAKSSSIHIIGSSILCDAVGYYESFGQWILNFLTIQPKVIRVILCLGYYNTISVKIICQILMRIEKYTKENNVNFLVHWYLQKGNEESLELLENFQEQLDTSIEITELDNQEWKKLLSSVIQQNLS
ncbi:MAG: hypothetical protein ACJAWV_000697 [Flammeovirgaceae bacterium]|jgi:hypothetical protein